MYKQHKIVGTYYLRRDNYIYNLSIKEEYRGRKYSHKLIEHCIKKNLNNPLVLNVFEKNKKAVHLYKSKNFKIVHKQYHKKYKEYIYTMIYDEDIK